MPSPSHPTAPNPSADLPALDPRSLGRPVHLLPRFAEQVGQGFAAWLQRELNRRYRCAYGVGTVQLRPLRQAPLPAGRWLVLGERGSRLACFVERSLVLSLMARRYGAHEPVGDSASTPPETSTEERQQLQLMRQIAGQALSLLGLATLPFAEEGLQQPQPDLGSACWLLELPIEDAQQGLQSRALCLLEPAAMDAVLRRLSPRRPPPPAEPGAQPPLPRLPLTLRARLLEQDMTLGQLLDLKPGDVVPVRLKRTEVLVDQSCLFTASVAEHQGKLCLTSFADAD